MTGYIIATLIIAGMGAIAFIGTDSDSFGLGKGLAVAGAAFAIGVVWFVALVSWLVS
jgi:hypothetical protein